MVRKVYVRTACKTHTDFVLRYLDVSFSIRGDEFYQPGDRCMPPLSGSGTSSFALVGASFLRRYYSVYDFGANQVAEYKPRIGFGRLKKQFDYLYQ